VGSPTARESHGDGGLVVVVGVTSHQGDWESQSQGEGDQVSVAGDRGGMRNAERHILGHASRVSGIQTLESRVQLQAACPVRRGLVGKGAHKCHLASQLLYIHVMGYGSFSASHTRSISGGAIGVAPSIDRGERFVLEYTS